MNALLTDAIKKRASDVHVEPYEKMLRVRFRIDGVLYEIMQPPVKLKNAITSRIKVMASLDIAERRMPQDGRIKLKLGNNREMDFRVSVLPTIFGEKVVLRLLDKSNLQLDMTKLGFEEKALADFKEAIYQPARHGAGDRPDRQRQDHHALLGARRAQQDRPPTSRPPRTPSSSTWSASTRCRCTRRSGSPSPPRCASFLRQDPDIIMVGEIRDFETAEIGVKAALTGHLVLSTLHTNDAPSTINRLLNMGVEPFLVASSINLIMAQRLVRVICAGCKEESEMTPEALLGIGTPPDARTGHDLLSRRGLLRLYAAPATRAGSRSTRSCR